MTAVLVTGGAGYIGSHTCKALAVNGYSPIVYDNLCQGHAEFVRWGDLVVGDVRDGALLASVFERYEPQAVIHFAASAYVGESVLDPQSYYENNVAGSLALLDQMRHFACKKLVFSSTCAVYGEVDHAPISLQTATVPINPYGRSKLMVENILSDVAAAHGIDSVALRYFNAAGADPDGEIGERHEPETHLIPNAIRAALGVSEKLQVFGRDYPTRDGTCIRDFIHVSDLASGHIAALKYLNQHAGFNAFNLGAGQGVSILQVIHEIERQIGKEVPISYQARRAGDPSELSADISFSQKALGWRPEDSALEKIIKDAINWEKRNLNI